jgi:3-hydroxyacyl-CoA dehydrogenase/enoyl-CoA hydratase/3-hydroxybutyryl-CoA epimerase
METCGNPVVAAINGTALGGGFELCLASHFRIAVNDSKTQIGLPEVLLGLLPGAGGTQRLPRMIGIEQALPLLLEGKKLRPEQALEKGLVNKLVATKEELIPAAVEWINTVGKKVQPWDDKGFKIPGGGVQTPTGVRVFMAGSALLQKKTFGNYPAPQAIMNSVYEGLQLDFDRALKVEMRYFTQCAMSQVAKNMIRTLFFTMNAANSGAARPKDVPANTLTKVGVLGAGMMGAGIAYVSAVAGLNVVLKDRSIEDAEKGKAYSVKLLNEKVSKGHMTKRKSR